MRPPVSDAVPHTLIAWLARAGRFANVASATNTLGVSDDAQAAELFLRDRACRSPHTLRAYRTELCWLVTWCKAQQLGPLSDLTRHNLLAYRQALRKPAHDTVNERSVPVSLLDRNRLLSANPAAGLVRGRRPRLSSAPQRMPPTALLAAYDAWVTEVTNDIDALVVARHRTIWTLYRYAGVRLVELVWSNDAQLPRFEVDDVVPPDIPSPALRLPGDSSDNLEHLLNGNTMFPLAALFNSWTPPDRLAKRGNQANYDAAAYTWARRLDENVRILPAGGFQHHRIDLYSPRTSSAGRDVLLETRNVADRAVPGVLLPVRAMYRSYVRSGVASTTRDLLHFQDACHGTTFRSPR